MLIDAAIRLPAILSRDQFRCPVNLGIFYNQLLFTCYIEYIWIYS